MPSIQDSDEFALRVSIADMNADGAFSLYPGIDRTLAILRGAGMALVDLSEGVVWRTLAGRFSSLAFAGERPLEGRLLDGPVKDFNVMVRRDAGTTVFSVIDDDARVMLASTCCLLFVAQGSAQIAFDDGRTLVLGESQFIEPRGVASIATTRGSVAFLVDFFPHPAPR